MNDDLHIYDKDEICDKMIVDAVKMSIIRRSRTKRHPFPRPSREDIVEYLLEIDDGGSPDIDKLKELIIFNMEELIGR